MVEQRAARSRSSTIDRSARRLVDRIERIDRKVFHGLLFQTLLSTANTLAYRDPLIRPLRLLLHAPSHQALLRLRLLVLSLRSPFATIILHPPPQPPVATLATHPVWRSACGRCKAGPRQDTEKTGVKKRKEAEQGEEEEEEEEREGG